jgi:epsilon-lactone hydrolase
VILSPERAGHAAPADLATRRVGLAAAVAAGVWRTEPAPVEVEIGGVRCLRFSPPKASRGTVLHIHGGAFRIGCPEQIAPFAAVFASRCGVTMICPAYRLAPEHPFPVGLNDLRNVVAALECDALILSGDSAGGGLAAALTTLCIKDEISLAGLALLSPWLDLTVTNPSYTTNAATDPLFSKEAATEAAQLYLQGHSAEEPSASPLHASVTGFPSTYINVGTGEVLTDDARKMHNRLLAVGVTSQLHQVDGMEHAAVTRDRTLPGAAETFDALADFIESRLHP